MKTKTMLLNGIIVMFLIISGRVSNCYCETLPQFNILTENWEPYNYQKDDTVIGISTDILVLILEKIGSTQGRKDIYVYPWARAYKTAQIEKNAILYTTARTEEREKMFKWVGPIFTIEFNFYALKKRHIRINSFKDLRNYKIGVLRGDVTEELLIKKTGMKVRDFEEVTSNEQNMMKLMNERIDLVPQSNDTTVWASRAEGFNPDKFESVFMLDKKGMYYAFSKNTPDWVIIKFQKAYNDIKKDGKVSEIFHKYGK
jgi:polar amino acid transport system substrate-binding protein